MGLRDSSDDAPSGAAGGTEASFQNLDIERLFAGSDEMTVMKTLQNMHLANFQLDNEIKAVMTEEIEPILLYSGNMLGMCSLVKQTQTAMNELATLCRTFDEVSGDAVTGKPALTDDDEELLQFMNQCATHYQQDGSFGAIFDKTEKLDRIDVLIKGIQMLKRLSMDNFRLVKRNKFLKSYKLLKVKSPVLMALVKHIIQDENHATQLNAVHSSEGHEDGRPDGMEGENYPKDGLYSHRRRLLGTVCPDRFRGFFAETQAILDYNTSKLLHNCETMLCSSNMGLLIEASICLALANEDADDYTSRLWEMRLDATKVASSRLVLGCLSSCEDVVSQLLTSIMYHIFCQRINKDKLARLKRLLEIPAHIGSDAPPYQQDIVELAFSDQSSWRSAMDLIRRNFERVDLDDIVDFYSSLSDAIMRVLNSLEEEELLLNVFTELGVDLKRELKSVSEDVLKQVKDLYHKVALASAMVTIEDIERRMQSREICSAQIKTLSKFVSKTDTDIAVAVNGRAAEAISRIETELGTIEGPLPADGILDTYGEEGSVQRWLLQSGLSNLILDVESFWPQLGKYTTAVLESVAKKCIVPLVGEDNTVKTLVGSSALSSRYSLLGARLFPQCLKRSCLEYCLDTIDHRSLRDKVILVLSFRDSGLAEGSDTLIERFKELEAHVGEAIVGDHTEEYESLSNFI